jgi:hypothetical protein
VSRVLERGDVLFAYRPRVDCEAPRSIDDVQRLYIVLGADGSDRWRRVAIGRKRLPGVAEHETHWAFVDRVGRRATVVRDLEGHAYATKTRGERWQPAARPAAEGRYAIAEHSDHVHLAYAIELPVSPGPAQRDLGIERQASYIVTVANPLRPFPPPPGVRAGTPGSLRALVLPDELGAPEHVAAHRLHEVLAGRAGREAQRRVERVELEHVAVRRAGRRARPAPAELPEVVLPLRGSVGAQPRRDSGGQGRRLSGNVVDHPVHPVAARRVGIVHDERERPRPGRGVGPLELGRAVLSVAGVIDRDPRAGLDVEAAQLERHAAWRCRPRALGAARRHRAQAPP